MYLPFIMITTVYVLRAIMRHLVPTNLKIRQLLVFLLGMYALILLAGCATGYARWVAFLRDGLVADAEVIFNGICTDAIFREGRYKRAYKTILVVPAETYDPQAQPFTGDLGTGSLIYRLQNVSAKASIGASVDSVFGALNSTNAQLRLSHNSAQQLVQTQPQLPALPQNTDVALSAGSLALATQEAAREQQGFRCIGYRFPAEPTGQWVYSQQDSHATLGQHVTVRYNPQYLEDNWLEKSIPGIMKSSINTAGLLALVLAETLFSGYWLGIRKKRKPQ